MRKIPTLLFLAVAFGFSALATSVTVNCTAFPANLGATNGATTTVSCPGDTGIVPVGAIDIDTVTLGLTENWGGGIGTSTTANITLTKPTLGGVTWATTTAVSTSLGGSVTTSPNFVGDGPTVTDVGTTSGGATSVSGVLASAFNVGLQSTYTGFLSNNSGYVTATYTYDTASNTGLTYTATCTASPANLGATIGATTTVSCPGFSQAGATRIDSVGLGVSEDWNGGNGTATTANIILSAPTFTGVSFGSSTVVSTSPAGNGGGLANFVGVGAAASDTTTGGPYALTAFASAYNVGLESTYTGFLSNDSGYVTETFDFDVPTPEPVSMFLCGSGLLAVAIFRRRKTSVRG